jgi:iron complex outermembrane receptor protein
VPNKPIAMPRLLYAITVLMVAFPAAGQSANPAAGGAPVNPDIVVNGILPAADDTYRVGHVEVGPLGDKALLDTPYSISVVPVNLAENQQLQNVRELFRYVPSVQGENIRPQSRGMQAGVVQNTRIDGLNIAATTDYAIEQFDRIEVLNGLAGALYGPANPAGTFNYVFKRPTTAPLNAFTVGYTSESSFIEHADISRRIGKDGWFGVRVNLLNQDGESYVDDSNLKRQLASVALDMQITPGTLIEANASAYRYVTKGLPGTFSLAKGISFPAAPDPALVGYGLPWAGDDNVTHLASGRLLQDLGESWHLTAGVLYMTNARASTVPTDTITSSAGAYTTTTLNTTFSLDRVLSNSVAVNGKVSVGGITNDLFLGTTGFTWKRYTPFQTGAITLGRATLANPIVFAQPVLPDFANRYKAQTTVQQSISFGDTVGFGDHLSVMVAASQSWIRAQTINRTGAITARYDDDGISPTASLIYKPRENMSAYVTYANSLQQGDSAPAGTVNAGEALAPVRSRQWEAGYKIDLKRVDVALAVYQIKRPYAFTGADGVYALHGYQRNRGVELTANGRITTDLNVFAGLSFIDPRLFDTGSATTSDKRVIGVPRLAFNALVEYRLRFLPAVTLTANENHASRRAGNYTNTDFVGSYDVVDLGARYQVPIAGRPVAFRINVLNVGNARYWANVAPTGQNGYNGTDNGTGLLGAPRTVRASMEIGL